MRKLLLICFITVFAGVSAQVQTPQPSPSVQLKQVVGLTNFEINYSSPSMRGREIFGDLVPFEKLWRTGANKNTTISFDDNIVFGGVEVEAGEYAIFSEPGEREWKIYLYKNTENWGTPREWNEELIAASAMVEAINVEPAFESFTISFGHFTKDSAHLIMTWANTSTHILIEVPSDKKVMKSIEMSMKDPTPADLYSAAVYFLETDRDINKAKKWIDQAMDARDDKPYWMLRQQSLIYAKAGEKNMAIKLAQQSLEAAQKARNADYVKMNKESLKEWGAY
ncbi:DUF2911 domain-containing protein [Mesohalobacter halotolerans]|uniref:DUF2911 domain-containing protein n=1 Tax=Mesohalobacter halotolerans TaxID=1883405 RepID=A0A4V6ALA9_9FLAO|nr:DUF2911 domain-containing protein [Mesohalobacter halotolerans]TKS55875.1 DUF2911 domain-containing protein [Mesohalobacter halotolerans]